jgi:putative PIN family toxin of toxin-antitoxin system
MRVVLDSNVCVSAFVLPGGAASQLIAALLRGRAEPLMSRPIMAEVLGVLGRKFAADREQLARTALFLSAFAEQVVPRERLHVLSDEPDNRILECAMVGHARWIVTGGRQLLKLGRYEGVQIVTVRAMQEYVAGSSSDQAQSGD